MKKIILSFALIILIMLGTASATNASTTAYFNINIIDNCLPVGWSGTYDVEMQIWANGNLIGTDYYQNAPTAGGCILFTFPFDQLVSDKVYTVVCVAAQRHGGTCTASINTSQGPQFFSQFESCLTTYTFNVTI